MKKTGRHLKLAWVLATMVIAGMGCGSGLDRVMDKHGFTPISPPQTQWQVGSIAEIPKQSKTAPVLRTTPRTAGAPINIESSHAPAVSQNHQSQLDLSVGVSIPAGIKVEVAEKGAKKYSVVAKGNVIERVLLDDYATQTFPVLKEKYGNLWGPAIDEETLYYFYELWSAKELEYVFYDAQGAKVKLPLPIEIPVEIGVGFEFKKDGSLVYHGTDPIYLGYKARPIRKDENGGAIRPHGGADTTSLPLEAKTQMWKEDK